MFSGLIRVCYLVAGLSGMDMVSELGSGNGYSSNANDHAIMTGHGGVITILEELWTGIWTKALFLRTKVHE